MNTKLLQGITIDRSAEKPIYRQIEERIEYIIRKNKIMPGDVIPSPKVLSDHLSVNELTVRRAIKTLIDRNVLISRQGRGTFVAGDANFRKILWVCGHDIFSGDISAFYTHFLRSCLDFCSEQDLTLDHTWLSADQPEAANKYCSPQSARNYAGYIFVGCDDNHPLLGYVIRNGLKYVNVTSGQVQSRRVVHNHAQALQLGLGHLTGLGHQHLVVIGDPDGREEIQKASAAFGGIKVEYVEAHQQNRFSDTEKEGYRLMCQLLLDGDIHLGFFILDDVIARGASRAILEHAQDRCKQVELVVICGNHEIIPFGLRTTYIVYNSDEVAKQAVRIVADQIDGRSSESDYFVTGFELACDQQLGTSKKEHAVKKERSESVNE